MSKTYDVTEAERQHAKLAERVFLLEKIVLDAIPLLHELGYTALKAARRNAGDDEAERAWRENVASVNSILGRIRLAGLYPPPDMPTIKPEVNAQVIVEVRGGTVEIADRPKSVRAQALDFDGDLECPRCGEGMYDDDECPTCGFQQGDSI